MKKEFIGFLTVDYDDGHQNTFKGLEVILTPSDEEIHFNTGDPLVDWYDYYKFVYSGEASEKGIWRIGASSSIDHWFMDGNEYIEKYLKIKETKKDVKVSFYTSKELDKVSFDGLNHIPKCVINKKMKTFQELKKYVKSKKGATL